MNLSKTGIFNPGGGEQTGFREGLETTMEEGEGFPIGGFPEISVSFAFASKTRVSTNIFKEVNPGDALDRFPEDRTEIKASK